VAKQIAKCPKCAHQFAVDPASTRTLQCPKCGASLAVPGRGPRRPRVDPLIGRSLGEFEVIELVGRGGMGAVYRGRQKSLDRIVAIKTLPRSLASSKAFVARFYREARNAATLSHPNVVRVYAVGEAEGIHYIAMEYIDGEGLHAVLSREGPLEPGRALEYLKQVSAGLAVAHEARVVHRDIKPSNLMVDREGRVHVTDFGLAKRTEGDVSVTQAGQALATPLYVAPEVASGSAPDPRSDLYSLGATFFHLIAGTPPFQGETFTELVIKHVNEKPPALGELAPQVDRRFAHIIDRLLRKNPGARYPAAGALLEELEALGPLAAGGPGAAAVAGVRSDARTPTAAVSMRRPTEQGPRVTAATRRPRKGGLPVAPIVGGVVAVGLLVACVALWTRMRGDRPSARKVRGTSATFAVRPQPKPPKVRPRKAKEDPKERGAGACFRNAHRAAIYQRWRTARSYVERLERDYSKTKFYRANRASLAKLKAKIGKALDKPVEVPKPPVPPPRPPTPRPPPPKPPPKPKPERDPALDWVHLTDERNLRCWRKVKGEWTLRPGQLSGANSGAVSILACELRPVEDMELTLEVMQPSGRIGDDVQIVFKCDGECPLLRLYWNGCGLCRQQAGRCIMLGKLPSPKGGEWMSVGLRVERGRAAAWSGGVRVESDKIGGIKPRHLRILQSSKTATYRNIRFRVLPTDPKYREFYKLGRKPAS